MKGERVVKPYILEVGMFRVENVAQFEGNDSGRHNEYRTRIMFDPLTADLLRFSSRKSIIPARREPSNNRECLRHLNVVRYGYRR